jgi:hypothetical protein
LVNVLFGIPFWIGWVFLLVLFAWAVFGIEQVSIGADGVHYRVSALVTLRRRHFPLEEIRGISEISTYRVDKTRHLESAYSLKLATLSTPLIIFQGLDAMERAWLLERIHAHLQGLLPGLATPLVQKESDASEVEVLRAEASPVAPPAENAIRLREEWDRTEFLRRRPFSLALLGVITSTSLFWNSIVGIFIFQLTREFNLFLFLFLIPFEVVGAGMVLSWCAVLLAPVTAERWTIGAGEVAARFSILGMGWSSRFDVGELDRIELRKNARSRVSWYPRGAWEDPREKPYTLVLVGGEGLDLLAIDDLTEGECRWLGSRFGALLKDSLPKQKPGRVAPAPASEVLWDRELDA